MKPFSVSNLGADRIDVGDLYISGSHISHDLTYPVVTGAFLDASTSTLHLLRTSEAPSIDIDLSNFGGASTSATFNIDINTLTEAQILLRTGDAVGVIAFGTDTKALYVYDGSTWQIFNNS
jgi:hypothetical protein